MKLNMKAIVFDGVTFGFLFLALITVTVQPSEEQNLNLSMNASIALGLFIFGCLLSILFEKMKILTWGEKIFISPLKKVTQESRPFFQTLWGWHAVLTLIVALLVGLVKTDFSIYELTNEDGFSGAMRLFQGIFSPDWTILPLAVHNIIETIFMALMATTLAVPIAFVLSFLAAKNVMKHPVAFVFYLVIRTILNVTRSVEALIWAIIFSVWVGIGPFAGMLALMIHSVASLAKQYSEMVEAVDDGPIEGILATGASQIQVVWFAIVPQIILPYIAFTVYRWDINVRMATIIGLVGGGGIGTLLIQYQGQAMWPQVGTIIVVIAVVVWLLDQASAYLREALK